MKPPQWMLELSREELSAEVRRTQYEIDLCTGDLRAWDLTLYDGDQQVALNALAWWEHQRDQLHRLVQRHLRVDAPSASRLPSPAYDWERVRYVDLVGLAQTLLGQEGRTHGHITWFRCPHGEKTGSLAVYPPGRGWHCFGCQKGGSDAVSFVATWARDGLGCSNVEALRWVEELADLPGGDADAVDGRGAPLPGVEPRTIPSPGVDAR